jgi:hypothetical protein
MRYGHPLYFGMRLPIHSLRGWMWPSPSSFLFGKVDEVGWSFYLVGGLTWMTQM